MADFDLDAARAARAEASGKGPVVKLGGKRFTLTPEVYIESVEALRRGDVIGTIKPLLGEKQWESFCEMQPTMQDCWAVVDNLGKLYAVESGEASASNGSSPKSGRRSRPTSKATTTST